ncbi:hypothetical protein M569_07940, partial [Genlisea aurea]
PFLCLGEKKKMNLFPLLYLHKEAPDPDTYKSSSSIRVVSSEVEFPLKKWVHIGCRVLRDFITLYIDGEVAGERHLASMFEKELHEDVLKRLYLGCPHQTGSSLNGYVHRVDVMPSSSTSSVRNHRVQNPPLQLYIDHSSASEIEDDSSGVWSASCRRIFSLDVTLSDVLGSPVNKDIEVLASLLYVDNHLPVESTSDGEPPLLTSYDGIEYASWDRPAKLVNGRASLKLKISQLSSKCDNRLFRIKFCVPRLGKYPFLEAWSPPIRCVSRNKNAKTVLPWRRCSNKTHDVNGCQCSASDDRSVELIPNIIHEAKPSPSSKRIKLGQDKPYSFFREQRGGGAYNGFGLQAANGNHKVVESNSSASNSGEGTTRSVSSPVSDSVVFKYCLGGTAERCQLLKEIVLSASDEQIVDFAKQVSLFSGCSHHRHQIELSKRLVQDGVRAWTSVSAGKNQVLWDNLMVTINECFMKIAGCRRPLLDQDLECLRRLAGCGETVSKENFEKLWSWLYPVAYTLSRSEVTPMWDSLSPLWIEGFFVTKERAESMLLECSVRRTPGEFVVRFPTTRSWPHPDAGSPVVTYLGSDSRTIRHRLVSLDSISSSKRFFFVGWALQDLLAEQPELSELCR